MAIPLHLPMPAATRQRPARRLRLLRGRRTWLQRFWQPQELYGLKLTLLLSCFLLAAAIH